MDKTNSLFQQRFRGRIHHFQKHHNPIFVTHSIAFIHQPHHHHQHHHHHPNQLSPQPTLSTPSLSLPQLYKHKHSQLNPQRLVQNTSLASQQKKIRQIKAGKSKQGGLQYRTCYLLNQQNMKELVGDR